MTLAPGALAGLRVATTRPAAQGGARDPLSRALAYAGASVQELPLTRVEPLDPAPLVERLREARGWDWVCFTSATAVRLLLAESPQGVRDGLLRVLEHARVAAVGTATAEALAAYAVTVALVPPDHTQEGMVAGFRTEPALRGTRVLLPTATDARDVLATALRAMGAEAEVVPVYRSVPLEENARRLAAALARDELDLVAVMAPSAVLALHDALPAGAHVRVASIGPVTSAAARECGLEVVAEASPHTVAGMLEAVQRWQRSG